MNLTPVTPLQAQGLLGDGARLVDIRSAHEFAEGSAAGAENHTLGSIEPFPAGTSVIFLCRTGKRTEMNAGELAALTSGKAYRVVGGMEAWRAASLATVAESAAEVPLKGVPLAVTGGVALMGLLLGWIYTAWWLVIPALVGIDMVYEGSTGSSAIARLIGKLPTMIGKVDPP